MYSIFPFPRNHKFPISGVYVILNKETNDCYVGRSIDMRNRWKSHLTELRSGHHHSIVMQRAWDKYGEKAFAFILVEVVEAHGNLPDREQFYMDALHPKYNVQLTAYDWLGMTFSDDIRAKMSATHKQMVIPPEQRAKMIEGTRKAYQENPELGKRAGDRFRGKHLPNETKAKLSAAKKGKTFSDEVRQKMGEAQKGRKHSEETKAKIVSHHIGAKRSEEARARMSAARKNKKPISEETREKLRIASLGRKHTDEERAKIGAAHKGKPKPGHTMSEETKAKLRERNKGNTNMLGKKHSEVSLAKMSAAQKGRTFSEETIRRMSEAQRRRYQKQQGSIEQLRLFD